MAMIPLRQIALLCATYDVTSEAIHIQGKLNEFANDLSRSRIQKTADKHPHLQIRVTTFEIHQSPGTKI